jgi:hypothetical protein
MAASSPSTRLVHDAFSTRVRFPDVRASRGNDPFAIEPLLAARSPVSAESRARTALLWRAADLSIAADFEGAATVMAEAVARDPDNPYYAYRLREFERLSRSTAHPPAR